ncbi:hypothetical protein [Micromonospora sp. NBC_01638]|uniref:hypothetical protein n=1 Tax=Micromonospora sp. NBC_01638 TaxID=2975982 RepID=UPI00386DEAF4|nr:hypothetical protein OG811_29960 [Micromonospora sp. NBC_01638]
MLAPTVAVGVVVLGLAPTGATAVYNRTSVDVADYVTPGEAANGNGLADLGLDVVDQLTTVVTSLAVASLLLSMARLTHAKTWAHATTCIVIAFLPPTSRRDSPVPLAGPPGPTPARYRHEISRAKQGPVPRRRREQRKHHRVRLR